MELVRATEAAAIRSFPFIGRGDKNGADGAAVAGPAAAPAGEAAKPAAEASKPEPDAKRAKTE